MRIALAQINATVGDIAGNEAQGPRAARARARGRRAARRSSPSWRSPATRPRTCCSRSTSSPTRARRVERIAADAHGIVALVGFPERADDVYNAAAVLADGARAGDLPQGAPAQLRRLRRAALLPARAGRRRSIEVDGVKVGLTICEDIWVPGRAADRRGAGRRAADRQHLRLALPRRQGPPARADDRPARPRQPRRGRLLRARRRPGRAGLRRPLVRRRPRRRRHRPRAAVRRGAAGRATSTSRPPAPARLRDTRARPAAREVARRGRRPRLVHDRAAARDPARAGRPGRRAARRRRRGLRARSCSARATTCARTASSTSCSGSRAAIDSTLVALHRRRRARARPRDLRDDALAVLLAGHARRRAATLAENLGVELLELPIGEAMAGYDDAAGRRLRRAASPTSPRRTSRRASAATC